VIWRCARCGSETEDPRHHETFGGRPIALCEDCDEAVNAAEGKME